MDRCDIVMELMVYIDCWLVEGNIIGFIGFLIENFCNGIVDDDGWYWFWVISIFILIWVFSDKDVEIGFVIFINCNMEIVCIDGIEFGGNGNLFVNMIFGESYFI